MFEKNKNSLAEGDSLLSYPQIIPKSRTYTQVTIDGVTHISNWDTNMLTFNGAVADATGTITGDLREAPGTSADKLYWMQIQGVFDPLGGTPSGGVEVFPGTVTLEWTNLIPMDPNITDVYVDVWFGTDPADPNSFVKVIDANTVPSEGLNLTSVDVDASINPQMYYWRVNTYVGGAGLFNGANMVEGALYNFIARSDTPASDVSAGDNMITWVNEPVGLLGSYTDDGYSTVTVAWSSSNPNVVFVPSLDEGLTSFHIAPQVTVDYAAGPVTLTFTVQDEGNPAVSATMTLNVYADACAAGLAAGISEIYPGDLNTDCVTDINDLIIMAQSWLVETSLTESVAK